MKRSPLWILAPLLLPSAALAQVDQAQLVQPSGVADLNAHLARLAADPRDVTALIGAGEAALQLDDARAAAGFFARADAISSGNGRIKAGLGRVNLKMQNPAEALRLFDQATRMGYPDATILSDRGLAKDMTGDQAGAQRDYQAALARTPGDEELERRYAASLGISGQVEAAEHVLKPLLYKSDRAAWRYRAFIYAMNNRQGEAVKIATQTMPAQLASAITPYMQKMPYLTAAQKAAAVHFGHFPAQVGTSIVAVVQTPAAPGAAAPVTQAATPTQVAARDDRRSRRARGRDRQLASADVARPSPTPAGPEATPPSPPPSRPTATQSQPTQQFADAPRATAATTTVTPSPTAQSGPSFAAARPVVQPLSASRTSPPQAVTPPTAMASTSAATMPTSPGGAVAGPPQPGFDTLASGPVPASPAPAPVPPAVPAQPTVGSQLNAITLAQASAPIARAPSSAVGAPATPVTASAPALEATPPPAPPPTQQPNPALTRTLADIIRAIDVPESERQSSVAAVDLAEVAQIQDARRAERKTAAALAAEKAKKAALAKAKAEADAKARAEAEEKKRLAENPSRNWVQIGVGRQRSALGFTFKAMKRKYVDIASQQGWAASWGQTNRLLIGPFASFSRAKSLEESLKAAGADAFAWRSDSGEVVERLSAD